ncbi:MAG: tRNA 2-thiocytidine biosynthesis protein TtcA [Oscillospiraceae bacterium]|nr:tRNA 2-thiocytidine biosynthesis protein TtcA [Oscillospiraceae bacterium]
MKIIETRPGKISLSAENSLRKEFHGKLLSPFNKAVKDYRLISPGDKIAVCISGGKDSMLMAKLLEEYALRGGNITLEYISLDPGYNTENALAVEENAQKLNIPLKIYPAEIFSFVNTLKGSPCFMCAKIRRGSLYARAKELGCNKIALGQHYDDIIETILMSMIYGGQVQTMMPRVHSANFPGMEIIRPLYFVREENIIRWAEANGLSFIKCACRFTAGDEPGTRQKVKQLISELKNENPQIESNIFRSVHNVKLSELMSYKDLDGEVHSFLERF